MINLMYLVLTAMLALNVSAEIINAFFMIDRGIEGSNNIIDDSNNFTLAALENNAKQDLSKYGALVTAANEVRTLSREFNAYVDSLRETLVEQTGGYYPEDHEKYAGRPHGYKNKDVTTRELAEGAEGEMLKNKIMAARDKLLSVINQLAGTPGTNITKETLADLEKSITLNISDDWETKVKKPISWQHFTFNQMPLASTFPIFRKFQNDMKSSEAAVLNYLVNQVGATTFKVDNFIPIASAPKSYVIAGESYEANITIGASSKSVYENMQIRVNGKALDVKDGIANYKTGTSGTGVQKYKVDIDLINPTTKEKETYSGEFEYEVGRRSVTVSADKMNVFYIGVENPVSVVAAGVSSNELRVSGSGGGLNLKSAGNGKFVATVDTPGEAKINVSGGGLNATSFDFRVKRIPDPIARLSRSSGGEMGNGEFKAQQGVGAFLDNFDFDAKCEIQGYNLVYVAKRQDAVESVNPGARYSDKSQRLVAQAKPGDVYYFDNVKARCPGDKAGRSINSMVFKIK